ncbi:MAG TPA: S8 family serine peptidase [Candidatus Binatia bacterium]|jgi:hypothetical protein
MVEALKTLVILAVAISASPVLAAELADNPLEYRTEAGELIRRSLTVKGEVTDELPFAAGELLVKFKDSASTSQKSATHRRSWGTPVKTFRHVKNLEQVKLPPGVTVAGALESYRKSSAVLYAEPNYRVESLGLPNDPSFTIQWNLRNTGQNGGTPGADTHALEAWNITTGSSAVVIAVIDTGVDYTHQDLAANMWRNDADCNNNGSDDDGNGYIDDCYGIDSANADSNPLDDNDHGTHVAGIIGAAGNNTLGIVGVNWNVKILPCKFIGADGYGYLSDAIACLDYVKTMKTRGVNIVATNNSWGGRGFSQALYDAIDAQRESGILFIAAAGNGYYPRDDDAYPIYPASYNLPNIIAVAATDENDTLTAYSHFGRTSVHLGAPGQNILSTVRGNAYASFSGTSMAAPHVAGLAALLKAQAPSRDWRSIKNLIVSGGDINSFLSGYTISGRRMNAQKSLACSNSTVLARVWPKANEIYTGIRPVNFSMLSINCGNPNGNVVVTINPGNQLVLLADDGNGFDSMPGDGIYSAQWTPPSGGVFTVSFPDGSVVTINVDKDLKAGFPVQAFNGPGSWMAGPINHTLVGNIDEDPKLEILASSAPSGLLYAWKYDGSAVPGWPLIDVLGAPYAALGELSKDSPGSEVFVGFFGLHGKLGAYTGTGGKLAGWPRDSFNTPQGPATLVDVDGDGLDEIFIDDYDRHLHAYKADGESLLGWPAPDQIPFTGQRRFTPAVADLDGDGIPEIISGTDPSCGGVCYYYIVANHLDGSPVQGFPILWTHGLYGYLAVGDVDGDGVPEIIAPGWNNGVISMLIFSADGQLKRSIPLGFQDSAVSGTAPALADLDGDGIPEIVVQTDGYITVLRGDGTTFPGWPFYYHGLRRDASPVVGDVDGDGLPDIVATMIDTSDGYNPKGQVLAFNRNGTLLSGFPKPILDTFGTTPAIADIDGDGRNEIIVTGNFWDGISGNYDKVWVYDLGGPPHGAIQWGQYMEGPKHHGYFKGGYTVPKKYTVNIDKTGPGNGVINGAGISCGVITCSGTYNPGDVITLSASPQTGSVFKNWSGSSCNGSGICTVTVNSDVWVTARFDGIYTLQVVKSGGGSGLVESYRSSDINCGNVCTATYTPGTTLMLIATPELGSNFLGFTSGSCIVSGFTCTITINSNTQVAVVFASMPKLHVTVSDAAGGDVLIGGGTICAADCSYTMSYGIDTSLMVMPTNSEFTFSGWSGDCGGVGSCVLSMTSDRDVTAHFVRPLSFASSVGGQVWHLGSKRPIQWSYATGPGANITKVNIDISRDGGLTWKSIAKKSPNDGAQVWKVNGPATNQAKIRICGNPYSQFCAVSDVFSIQ